ncbi:hypothetical protein D3C84_29140 [compost metagenome]
MSHVTLAIRHLRDEQSLLRTGGLYWLSIDRAGDAEILGRQFLAALVQEKMAALVCCGQAPEQIAGKLDDHAGPAELKLFEIAERDILLSLKVLPADLDRAGVANGGQVVLMLPASSWQAFDARLLQRWCETMAPWLRKRACRLLVLCHGQAPNLHGELIRLNEHVSGLGQLYRRDGGIHYQLHYWRNELGVASAQDFEFEVQPEGFALTPAECANPQATHNDDQRIYLTQRAVLEGTPALSEQWRLFESRDDLLQQAVSARAASVIVAIESNKHVEQLARQLYDLRERCGVALKIIVREIEPCLRYRDERLLVSCGANIVVPFGAQLAHFFSVIDSVQGQVWRRSRANDIAALFERLRPPDERGLLSPQAFLAILDQIFASASGEVSHQLLRLQPRKGLNIEQCLNQISLRRFGDIACVLDGDFYLFLFACRSDGLESALGNVCRLPWRDLFKDIRFFAGVEDLPRKAFIAAAAQPAAYQLAATHSDSESAPSRSAYMPQRISLPITDNCA